jgi:hypothetical protein
MMKLTLCAFALVAAGCSGGDFAVQESEVTAADAPETSVDSGLPDAAPEAVPLDGGPDVPGVDSADSGAPPDSGPGIDATDACVVHSHQLAFATKYSGFPKGYTSCVPKGIDEVTYSAALLAEQVDRTIASTPTWTWEPDDGKVFYCDGASSAPTFAPGSGKEQCVRRTASFTTSTMTMTWCRSGAVRGRWAVNGGSTISCPVSADAVTWW